jgi:DNA-binding beta-propeller fold protein YncE
VNPGSDSLTAFRVDGDRLRSPDAVPTGGEPISVTSSGDVAYTVNGRSLDISGAEVDRGGDLQPLRGSTQELNPFAAAPAEIAFTPGGRRLVVTEKGSNSIDVFGVTGRGRATAPVTSRAVGSTPFGFDVDRQGRVFVSNAGGPPNSTSYRVRPDRKLQPLTPPAASGQGAACWLVLTPDGGYAFTANTGSGTVSSYAVNPDGSLRLLQAVAARTAGAPADESVTQDGRDLYVRVSFSSAGGNPARTEIQGFSIGSGGTLTALGASVAVPVSSAGVLAD